MPARFEVRTEYNPEKRTAVQIVPALVGTILNITMVVFTAGAVVREVLEANQTRITKILDNQDKLIKAARAEDFLNQWQGGSDSFGAMVGAAAIASGSPLVAHAPIAMTYFGSGI